MVMFSGQAHGAVKLGAVCDDNLSQMFARLLQVGKRRPPTSTVLPGAEA